MIQVKLGVMFEVVIGIAFEPLCFDFLAMGSKGHLACLF